MNLRQILTLPLCFLVATCGVVAVVSTSDKPATQFAAHEFALLRSEYTSLRTQSVGHRVRLFRDLQTTLETIEITPGMAGSVAEFCEEVMLSREERAEVKSEAKLTLEALARHREPRSVHRLPASVAPAKD